MHAFDAELYARNKSFINIYTSVLPDCLPASLRAARYSARICLRVLEFIYYFKQIMTFFSSFAATLLPRL